MSAENAEPKAPVDRLVMPQHQFEYTARFVWCSLRPWLELHFGPKCDEYEFGCECCERWKLAEELLAYDRFGPPPHKLEKEIETLRECLRWREELLAKMQASQSA
jgi:hypothetical protein